MMTQMTPPSGRTIVAELLHEMEARLYPLMYRTLAPSVFHVYLHPDDYREIAPIAAAIVADASQALNARVDELNGRSRWSRMVTGRQAPLEVPAGGWQVHLHPEPNGELSRGELGIESQLSIPPPPRYEGGVATTRIARTTVTGTIRRSTSDEVPASPVPPAPAFAPASVTDGAAGVAAAVVPPVPAIEPPATATQPGVPSPRASSATARLSYLDEDGPHVYTMRKELISIGRGGSAHWVDVQVVGSPRVSREHCRIRRAADGRYYLQDVSTWGTSVDGTPVPPFARQVDGRVDETGHEQALASGARIQLADAVTIEFSVEA